jgi:membrane protein YdbS with pleckstrin-like domain
MSTEFDNLKNKWQAARKDVGGAPPAIGELVAKAEAKKKSTLYFQYGNIIVLSFVLIGISLCFYFFFPFRELLSRSGVFLMIAGLMIRIGVETFSTIKSKNIQFTDHALKATTNTLEHYNFRKTVNGPVTITLVVVYVIGFYMLTPEFIKYVDWRWMLLFDSLFTVSGVILIWQIRKGIRKEMDDLKEMVQLQEELNKKV